MKSLDADRGRVSAAAALPAATSERSAVLAAGGLERAIGRPAPAWTVDDLVATFVEGGFRLVALMHVGGDGWLKTLDFVPRSRAHLADVLEGGERADGSSLFPGLGIRPGASDVVLRPRLETAFVDPFAPLPTLAVLCGHAGRDGAPLPQSPDTLVRRAHERLVRETGVELHALGEIEYFLGRRANENDVYGADDRGYHATAPFVFGEALRRRALAALAEIGVPVKYGHAEVGYVLAEEAGDGMIWEQHEIELALAPLPAAADGIALTQWVLRRLAHEEGLRASFEPVLRRGHAGTGLHVHLSPVAGGAHDPVRGPGGRLTDPARWLIGGLVRHGAALMAFGNRVESSFVRLAQAREAPSAVSWGEFDRGALVRLPILATHPDGRPVSPPTVEFRLPDGSAHPHLLLAGVAQAMAAGRELADLDERLAAAEAARLREGGGRGAAVPRSFRDVAAALRAERAAFEAGGVFPADMVEAVAARLESL
uniref:Glutamine synthetase n=1 Tax=Eiseniibacteriota bacterium TaxID=2212470 RepID=A0A832ML51_UNCEI